MLVDDFSRLFVHGAWMTEQNTRAGQQVLRAAIQRRGQPEIIYIHTRHYPVCQYSAGRGDDRSH